MCAKLHMEQKRKAKNVSSVPGLTSGVPFRSLRTCIMRINVKCEREMLQISSGDTPHCSARRGRGRSRCRMSCQCKGFEGEERVLHRLIRLLMGVTNKTAGKRRPLVERRKRELPEMMSVSVTEGRGGSWKRERNYLTV